MLARVQQACLPACSGPAARHRLQLQQRRHMRLSQQLLRAVSPPAAALVRSLFQPVTTHAPPRTPHAGMIATAAAMKPSPAVPPVVSSIQRTVSTISARRLIHTAAAATSHDPEPEAAEADVAEAPASAPGEPATAQEAGDAPGFVDFDEEWVNLVGLSGVVLKGPHLYTFNTEPRNTASRKAVMVLGLYNKDTADPNLAEPRPILVQAWDDKADSLVQGVRMGDSLFLTGHLAIDRGQDQRTSWRGPALVVQADNWQQIATESIPPGKRHYADRGEFDLVFSSRPQAAAPAAAPAAARPAAPSAQRATASWGVGPQAAIAGSHWQGTPASSHSQPAFNQQPSQSAPSFNRAPSFSLAQASQMFFQGKPLSEIAASVNAQPTEVFRALLKDAERQGANSQAWRLLLAVADLAPANPYSRLDAVSLFDAVCRAVQACRDPTGQERLKPIRQFLLQDGSGLGALIRQQEAGQYPTNQDLTYAQIRLMLAMRRVNAHPSQHV